MLWAKKMHAKKIILTGARVTAKALRLAESLGDSDFKASYGWFLGFKKRHFSLFIESTASKMAKNK